MTTQTYKRVCIKISHGIGIQHKMGTRQLQTIAKKYSDEIFVSAQYHAQEKNFDIQVYNCFEGISVEKLDHRLFFAEINKILRDTNSCDQMLYLETNLGLPGTLNVSSLAEECIRNITHQYLILFTETERLIEILSSSEIELSKINAKEIIRTSKVFNHMDRILDSNSTIKPGLNTELTDYSNNNYSGSSDDLTRHPIFSQKELPSQSTSIRTTVSSLEPKSPEKSFKQIIKPLNIDTRLAESTEIQHEVMANRYMRSCLGWFFSCLSPRPPRHAVLPEMISLNEMNGC